MTAFLHPHEGFDLTGFVDRLRARGQILFPTFFSERPTFRVANIGSIDREEIAALLADIKEVLPNLRPVDSIPAKAMT